jgi:phosphate transport system permease protein
MTTISETRVARTGDRLRLRGARLPDWAAPAAVLAAVALTAGLFAVTDLAGTVGFLLVAVPLAVAAVTAVTAVVEGRRRATDRLVTAVVYGAFVLAVTPLVSVLVLTVTRGLARLDGTFLTHSMRNVGARDAGGGAYHAILGTLQQVGIASALAIPLGLLTAVYLVEYGRGSLARVVSFFVDVMTGLPSIVAGLFILAFWVLVLRRGFSGFAGALALSILMVPVVVRSAEEMLRLVPGELREASFALGIPRWKTIARIVLPTALPGIVTGIMLAVARVTGETAPLLLTVFGNASINPNPFAGPQSALPLFVFTEAGKPNEAAIERAWAGALTLILLVMVLNLAARALAARRPARR